jgi:hypothetical protein
MYHLELTPKSYEIFNPINFVSFVLIFIIGTSHGGKKSCKKKPSHRTTNSRNGGIVNGPTRHMTPSVPRQVDGCPHWTAPLQVVSRAWSPGERGDENHPEKVTSSLRLQLFIIYALSTYLFKKV